MCYVLSHRYTKAIGYQIFGQITQKNDGKQDIKGIYYALLPQVCQLNEMSKKSFGQNTKRLIIKGTLYSLPETALLQTTSLRS